MGYAGSDLPQSIFQTLKRICVVMYFLAIVSIALNHAHNGTDILEISNIIIMQNESFDVKELLDRLVPPYAVYLARSYKINLC